MRSRALRLSLVLGRRSGLPLEEKWFGSYFCAATLREIGYCSPSRCNIASCGPILSSSGSCGACISSKKHTLQPVVLEVQSVTNPGKGLPLVGCVRTHYGTNQIAVVAVVEDVNRIVLSAGLNADNDVSGRPGQLRRALSYHDFRGWSEVGDENISPGWGVQAIS